ncbi:MAG: integrase core domain-containing protein [Chromatiaceae bacterium]
MDVYGRKIVGWEVYPEESAEHAATVFHKAHRRAGVRADALVLHSDNGTPLKGATLLVTLQRLGVVPSFSRPAASTDNPYSESLFKTLKGRPSYPAKPFETSARARAWVDKFVNWYNDQHFHSALKFVTPAQRQRGEDAELLVQSHAIYQAARAENPARWSGITRDWPPTDKVFLNPGRTSSKTD